MIFPVEIRSRLLLTFTGLAAASHSSNSLFGSPQKAFPSAQPSLYYVLFVCCTIAVWLLRLSPPSGAAVISTYYSKSVPKPRLPLPFGPDGEVLLPGDYLCSFHSPWQFRRTALLQLRTEIVTTLLYGYSERPGQSTVGTQCVIIFLDPSSPSPSLGFPLISCSILVCSLRNVVS